MASLSDSDSSQDSQCESHLAPSKFEPEGREEPPKFQVDAMQFSLKFEEETNWGKPPKNWSPYNPNPAYLDCTESSPKPVSDCEQRPIRTKRRLEDFVEPPAKRKAPTPIKCNVDIDEDGSSYVLSASGQYLEFEKHDSWTLIRHIISKLNILAKDGGEEAQEIFGEQIQKFLRLFIDNFRGNNLHWTEQRNHLDFHYSMLVQIRSTIQEFPDYNEDRKEIFVKGACGSICFDSTLGFEVIRMVAKRYIIDAAQMRCWIHFCSTFYYMLNNIKEMPYVKKDMLEVEYIERCLMARQGYYRTPEPNSTSYDEGFFRMGYWKLGTYPSNCLPKGYVHVENVKSVRGTPYFKMWKVVPIDEPMTFQEFKNFLKK